MALGMTKPILQIVGFQNSGKTTLIEKVITHMTDESIRIGVLKHHGHGGKPDSVDSGKDTERYRKAGAAVTAVEGAGMLQLHAEVSEGWSLEELLRLYDSLPVDVILVEGFKREAHPKVVILRTMDDWTLLEDLTNIVLVLTWFERESDRDSSFPTFPISEEAVYLSWLSQYLKGGYNERKKV